MPLINNFELAGPGVVTSFNRGNRAYRVGTANDFIDYFETTDTETVEWVGLTYNAAINQVLKNTQPGDRKATHSWSFREDNRVIGSYIVQRDYEKKVLSVVATTPTDLLVPTFSPAGRTTTDIGFYLDTPTGANGQITVTLTFRNTGSVRKYRSGFARSNTGDPDTAGLNQVNWSNYFATPLTTTTNNSYNITLQNRQLANGDIREAIYFGPSRNNVGYRRILRIYGEETLTLLTGTYSTSVERIFYADMDPWPP